MLMDVLHTHCAGLDIHKDTVVACSRRVTAGKVIREVRTFKTTTSELLALSDWLGSLGATHIAMEATGVYWKPVWNILSDGDFELILANAMLGEALRGRVTRHHRFLLRLHLQQIDALDRAIAEIDKEVEANLAPFRELIPVLTSIPGIGELAARVLLAEIGTDMSRFPTSGHLISWAGLCPRNDQSAGKRRSTRMRKGAPWLKTVLIQCAWAGARKKGSYLEAQFHRLRARRGAKKAVGAVAASILTAAYHMIAEGTFYQDLGADHFQRRAKPSQIKRLVAKIQSLGYNVEIKPLAA